VLPKAIGFNELDQSTHYSKVSGYTCTGVGIGGGVLHFAERPKIVAACAVARISPRAPSRTICYAALTRFLRAMGKFACVCLLALSAARRSSSSNSRSFAEILRPMVFRWAAILPSLGLFEGATE
jgi:hypothetical protein